MKLVCVQEIPSRPHLIYLSCVIALLLLASGRTAHSTTYTWNNPLGGNWNLFGNWSPNGKPGSGDTAIVPSGTFTVTVSDAEAVGTLTMNGTSGTQTLNITSGGTLSINSASTGSANAVVTVTGGTLNGTGSLALAGPLDWTGGTISSGVLFGGGGFSSGGLYLDGGMLTNDGVLNWSNNAVLFQGNGSFFTNLPAATITVSNTFGTYWDYGGYSGFPAGSHVFGNGGTITVDATGTLTMYNENFVNAGTLNVNSGTLSLSGGTNVDSGPVNVVTGATLELGGADTFTAASSISGAGNLLVSGGTVALNSGLGLTGGWTFSGGATTITGPDSAGLFNSTTITVSGGAVNFNGSGTLAPLVLAVSSGTLAGSQSLVAATFNWTGGTISLGVWFAGGGFSSGGLYLDGGMLTNDGVLNWSNNAVLYQGNGSFFTNLPAATITVSNTFGTYWDYGGYSGFPAGSHVFGNGGTITVDATGTLTMYNENFVNAGTLNVNSGTLSLNGGTNVDSGPVNVVAGATLELGGADTFTAASSINGAGNLLVSGGTAALNSGLGLTGFWTFSGGTTTITGPDSASYLLGTTITVSGGTVNFNGSGSLEPLVLALSSGTLAGPQNLLAATFNWSGGTITNTGVLFNGGGFSSGGLYLDGGMLTNDGVLNWSNNAVLFQGNGSFFTNLPAATITVSNTFGTYWDYGGYSGFPAGSHVFGNGGTITVDATGTLTMYNENFVNSGTVTVNSGTLSLSGGTQNLANGTLNFGINNLTTFGSISFSGPADLGGTLTATFNDPTFAPAANDAWPVMTYGSLAGAFSKINLPPIAVWQTIAGSTSYTIKIVQLASGYQPVIVQDLSPTNYALVGEPTVLSVQVEGSAPLTNQWYSEAGGITNALNNGDRGGRIAISTTSLNPSNAVLSLTIANAQTSDAGPYQVFVTNGFAPYSTVSSVGQLVVELEPLFNVNGSLWTLNGGATIKNNVLTLTDGQPGGEARSVFFNYPMYGKAFRVAFTYQSAQGTTATKADGVTFCVQNTAAGAEAVGTDGGSLGYTGITNSMAIAIDQFTAKGFEYVTNGQNPATLGQYVLTAPVDPSSGDPINVSIVYETNAISLSLTDAVTLAKFVTNVTVGPLPINSASAFVGFTGGSGDLDSVQTISNFSFVPIPPMSAARNGTNGVLVSWPTGIGGYQLQSSTNLGTAIWSTLPGPYNAVGQQYQLPVPPAGNAFYRLTLPAE
jgi:hypothetical protein